MNLLRNVWEWAGEQFVGEVPRDYALCEFDCRKPQCREAEWKNCARRLQRAAGELMPAKRPTSKVVADSTPDNNLIHHGSTRI